MPPYPRYVLLEKPAGQTPLEAVNAWKTKHPEFAALPATYAGRLDPMASGKLLVLLGAECKKRNAYTGLDKEYEIEVVLDLSTDTGGALGMPMLAGVETHPSAREIAHTVTSLRGSHEVPYPAFSSKTVNGKPLFQYALEGMLATISIPIHTETIYRIELSKCETMPGETLGKRIQEMLSVVPRSNEPSKALGADFRQDTIRTAWQKLLRAAPERQFQIISLCVTCASGAYMRTLAERLGSALGTRGFALSIHRTKIGTYLPLGPFGFWRRRY